MKRFLSRCIASFKYSRSRSPLSRQHRARLEMEHLEGRLLMSAAPVAAAAAPEHYTWALTKVEKDPGNITGKIALAGGYDDIKVEQDHVHIHTVKNNQVFPQDYEVDMRFADVPLVIETGTTATVTVKLSETGSGAPDGTSGYYTAMLDGFVDYGALGKEELSIHGTRPVLGVNKSHPTDQGTFTIQAPTRNPKDANQIVLVEHGTDLDTGLDQITVYTYQKVSSAVPTLIGPKGLVKTSHPEFHWTKVDPAKSYELEVTEDGGTSPVIDEKSVSGTSYAVSETESVPTLMPGHKYHARVKVAGSNQWSNTVSFEIQRPEAPKLESKRGAPKTIYLDFIGHDDPAYLDAVDIHTPPFDLDNNFAHFGDLEKEMITDVYKRVAEFYKPFNVNVTTVQPVSEQPNEVLTVVIGNTAHAWQGKIDDGTLGYTAVGAFFGEFDFRGSKIPVLSRSFIYQNHLMREFLPSKLAEEMSRTVAHEAGHAFGLTHQVSLGGGQHVGDPFLAPIMQKNPSSARRDLWWQGTGENGPQDDWQMLKAVFGLRDDRVAHSRDKANSLDWNNHRFDNSSVDGIIADMDVHDWYQFTTNGENKLSVSVKVPEFGALRAVLLLRDSNGKLLAARRADNNLNLTLEFDNLPAGRYYLEVKSSGFEHANPTSGRTDDAPGHGYNLGSYELTGTLTPVSPPKDSSPTQLINRLRTAALPKVESLKFEALLAQLPKRKLPWSIS